MIPFFSARSWKQSFLVLTAVFTLSVNGLFAAPVDLTFTTWTGNKDQLALLQSFVDEFNTKATTPVNVTFQTIPFAEYTTKLALQLQGSTPPDLGWILETTAPTFIESGTLVDLNASLKAYNPDDLNPLAMALWKKANKTYAVPFSTSPFFVFYNEDLFRQAGVATPPEQVTKGTWTWESFKSAAAAIKKTTGVYGFQGTDGQMYDSRILHTLLPVVRAYGGDAWVRNQVMMDGKGSIDAVSLVHSMLNKDLSIVPPGNQSDFYAGAAAMTFGQVSRVSKLASVTWKWGIAPMPKGPMGSHPIVGQAALGAFAKSKNAKVASELVAYMTSASCVTRMAGIWPPARMSVLFSDAFLQSNPAISPETMKSVVADAIRSGQVLPAHVMSPQIELETKPLFDKLWKPETDVKATLGEIAKVMRKYVK